jgi:LuxR family transcriptional regulator, maltose regulon positive regulatory protein
MFLLRPLDDKGKRMADPSLLPQRPLLPEPLLATKLHVPVSSHRLLVRPRLLRRLSEGMEQKLTLLSAPAGSGKTMLLSAWLASPAGRDVPVAWLSLDEEDNDPGRFWRYVCTALGRVHPDVNNTVSDALHASQPLPFTTWVTLLINTLATVSRPFLFVLDDYHLISTSAIHQALTFLLEHSPESMHLVISTREDPPLPLARWRARGQLVEIRASDLRFTLPEVASFFTEVMGLELAAQEIATLEARTEGWITGLQLAALSLQERGSTQIGKFLAAFAGSHRYILDYLVEEVLVQQSPDLQTFLLQTAILNRLSAPLCDAVTKRTDSQAVLEQLEQRNLFLVSLDDERHWYRYHHLFSDVLKSRLFSQQRQRLLQESVPTLHLRACLWYEQHGLLSEAIHHALAAPDFDRAAHLCEQVMQVTFARGELPTLLRWLAALPHEVLRCHPHLCVYYVRAFVVSGQPEAAKARVEDAEHSLREYGEPLPPEEQRALAGELVLMRVWFALLEAKSLLSRELCEKAASLLPVDHQLQSGIPLLRGVGAWLEGEVAQAATELTEASRISRVSHNHFLFSTAQSFLAQVRALQGQLQEAIRIYHAAFQMAAHLSGELPTPEATEALAGQPPSSSMTTHLLLPQEGGLAVGLAALLYEQNALMEAEEYLQHGLRLGQDEGNIFDVIGGKIILARIRQAQANPVQARTLMQQAIQLARRQNMCWTWVVPGVSVSEIRLALMQGNLAVAQQWAEAYVRETRSSVRPAYLREVEEMTLARVYIAEGRYAETVELLAGLRREASEAGRNRQVLELLVLQALAHQARGASTQALSSLSEALHLAVPQGYTRIFVDEGLPMRTLLIQFSGQHSEHADFVSTLLAAFDRSLSSQEQLRTKPQPLPEPLSERELEVLRLLATGASNQQIADQLVVAVSTVKRHVHNILGKLNARSRAHAVAHARELHLL